MAGNVRKCRRQLGSDTNETRTLPEKPAGMSAVRYAWLLDRLDAAENDLGLPLTLGGPRFAYRPDRNSCTTDRRAMPSWHFGSNWAAQLHVVAASGEGARPHRLSMKQFDESRPETCGLHTLPLPYTCQMTSKQNDRKAVATKRSGSRLYPHLIGRQCRRRQG